MAATEDERIAEGMPEGNYPLTVGTAQELFWERLTEPNLVQLLITDNTRRGVAYVSALNSKRVLEPQGTTFFVDIPHGQRKLLTYAVTARHVIEDIPNPVIEGIDPRLGEFVAHTVGCARWSLLSRFAHLAAIALRAISRLRSGLTFFIRAATPFCPPILPIRAKYSLPDGFLSVPDGFDGFVGRNLFVRENLSIDSTVPSNPSEG